MSKKTKVIVRRSTKNAAAESDFSERPASTDQEQMDQAVPDPEVGGQIQEATSPEGASEVPLEQPDNLTQPSQIWASVSGYNLENANRGQQYFVRSMLVFADCCLQHSPEGIFDVLGRNFDSPGFMAWWLHRIGKGHIAPFVKGKDMVDAVRKVAHELYRELKRDIGRPVARW